MLRRKLVKPPIQLGSAKWRYPLRRILERARGAGRTADAKIALWSAIYLRVPTQGRASPWW